MRSVGGQPLLTNEQLDGLAPSSRRLVDSPSLRRNINGTPIGRGYLMIMKAHERTALQTMSVCHRKGSIPSVQSFTPSGTKNNALWLVLRCLLGTHRRSLKLYHTLRIAGLMPTKEDTQGKDSPVVQLSPNRVEMNRLLGTAQVVDPSKSLGYTARPVPDDPPPTCRMPPQRGQPMPMQRQPSRSARRSSLSGAALSACQPPPIAPLSPPVPPPPPSESQIWWQNAEAPLPARIWLNNLHKKAARHVRLPRSAVSGVAGSQHPQYTIENTPLSLVKAKCVEAGLILDGEERVTKGSAIVTTWKGKGLMTAFNFCQVEKTNVSPHALICLYFASYGCG